MDEKERIGLYIFPRMKRAVILTKCVILLCNVAMLLDAGAGPLRVHPSNPRYFTDGSGKPIYLTGSHTWQNLQDRGPSDPPPTFDYNIYLNLLQKHNHNFIRMWRWEFPKFRYKTSSPFQYSVPHPWARTGPGTALDGKPKFDLTQFNQAYFDRLRARVIAAHARGIYVSIMLFEGHAMRFASQAWFSHPLNIQNNVNGIDGDPNRDGKGLEIYTLDIPSVTAIQEAYVRKVIDTVNDLDNVLYEICNEADALSSAWQYHLIHSIQNYERDKPQRHPVGMTAIPPKNNPALFASPSEWVSPSAMKVWDDKTEPYASNMPTTDGNKVVLLDTDHIGWKIYAGDETFQREWVWKSFTRGYNPIWMDDIFAPGAKISRTFEEGRRAMGYTRTLANRLNEGAMVPRGDLCSSNYCLANPGNEYLVYVPPCWTLSIPLLNLLFRCTVIVDLSGCSEKLIVQWFNPSTGEIISAGKISCGRRQTLSAPFSGDAVLYLKNQ